MLTPDVIRLEQARRELARRSYPGFVSYINPGYDWQPFHQVIASHLNDFEKGLINKLMITVPPQHGKSELSTRNFPPYLFGKNPKRKLAVLSFSANKAGKFSREIQLKMADEKYSHTFPAVRLPSPVDEGYVKTQQVFDIVGTGGSLKAVGKKGPITGDPVDIVILDDLMKDGQEAQSLVIREATWDWIEKAVETRLHNGSQMLYVTTRWHENDPSGRFLERDGFYSEDNPEGWVLLNFEAIKTANIVSYDPRYIGQALWPEKHSLARMQTIREKSPATFNALYQGDPKPSTEALVYSDWIEVEDFPATDTEFYGMDFGYSNDPTTLIRIGISGRNMYLDELVYETGLTNPDILERAHLARVSPHKEVIADNAEPKSIEELRRGTYQKDSKHLAGLNIKACTKGPGSINAGIQKLKEYRVYYTKRSLNLKREVRNYQWIMANGVATNTPIDAYNHALDAVRSAVYTKYKAPVGRMKASVPMRKTRGYFNQ